MSKCPLQTDVCLNSDKDVTHRTMFHLDFGQDAFLKLVTMKLDGHLLDPILNIEDRISKGIFVQGGVTPAMCTSAPA